MTDDEMEAVYARKHFRARVLGVLDLKKKQEAAIAEQTRGEAIGFIAFAHIDGFDARAASVFYGDNDTSTLSAKDCAQLWAKYGKALLAR